jgi:hypothetical protein
MTKSFILTQRPFVVFDAANAEHRGLYNKFLKTRSWKHSTCQWLIDDSSLDVVHNINRKMIQYYMSQEFSTKKTKKPSTKKILTLKTANSKHNS